MAGFPNAPTCRYTAAALVELVEEVVAVSTDGAVVVAGSASAMGRLGGGFTGCAVAVAPSGEAAGDVGVGIELAGVGWEAILLQLRISSGMMRSTVTSALPGPRMPSL